MPRLHVFCKVCGASQSSGMMRPLLSTLEMRTADVLQDSSHPPAAYSYVCRDCWLKFVTSKKKGELITILETVSCDLHEFARALGEKNKRGNDGEELGDDLPF